MPPCRSRFPLRRGPPVTDASDNTIADVRAREVDIGGRYRRSLEQYRLVLETLIDLSGEALEGLREGEPTSEHAVALILARIATEALAVLRLLECGYPVQAFALVGTMLELMHTAAYIGNNDERAKNYFEHADKKRAYPGSVKSTIVAVGKELDIPKATLAREYDDFYNQMCLVKHGNPMAMGLGTVADEEDIYLFIGPVFTTATVRVAFSSAQQAARYLLLTLTVFARHHRPEDANDWFERLKRVSDRWLELNAHAERAMAKDAAEPA